MTKITDREAVKAGLRDALQNNSRVFLNACVAYLGEALRRKTATGKL